jgi:hypothetical protein
MKIPIIFLTWNRFYQFKDSLNSFLSRTDENCYDLIICDNKSTQPGMQKYLNELRKKFIVIENYRNVCHEGWAYGILLAKERLAEYGQDTGIIISDPDILLYPEIPLDWPIILKSFLDHHKDVSKVGLALDTSYLPKGNPYRLYETKHWRSLFKTDLFTDPCYDSLISTTTCMVRWDSYGAPLEEAFINGHDHNAKYKHNIRVAGRFICKHLGWGMKENYFEDFNYLDGLHKTGNKVQSYAYHQEAGLPNIYSGWK